MTVLEIVFWSSIGVIAYTLFGYPLLTLVLAAVVRKRVVKRPCTPKVSFVIAAYNEERAIAEKIEQTLSLDYPSDHLEIIVASDGSTDRTDEIVRSFEDRQIKLYRCEGRRGKAHTLNETVLNAASGEVIVFSDATGVFNRDAVRELAANFADPHVGCVTGRVAYRYGGDMASSGFKGYQRIAVAIRRAESAFGSQTSVSGSIHAIRRELYRPVESHLSHDVIDAVHTVEQGYRVVYENDAVSVEASRSRMRDEFRCRVRMAVRAAPMVPYVLGRLLRRGRIGYALQMISHKFMRWYLWVFLLAALVSNLTLVGQSKWYSILCGVQGLMYLAAVGGLLANRVGIRLSPVATLSMFVLGNTAMCVGAAKALLGKRMPTWEPVR